MNYKMNVFLFLPQLTKTIEQKDKLQQQVNLLYDDNLDLDLLDELARKAFAILKKNEKLLILKKKSKL